MIFECDSYKAWITIVSHCSVFTFNSFPFSILGSFYCLLKLKTSFINLFSKLFLKLFITLTRGLLSPETFLLPMNTSFSSENSYRWLNSWNPKGNELSYCTSFSIDFFIEITVRKCLAHLYPWGLVDRFFIGIVFVSL